MPLFATIVSMTLIALIMWATGIHLDFALQAFALCSPIIILILMKDDSGSVHLGGGTLIFILASNLQETGKTLQVWQYFAMFAATLIGSLIMYFTDRRRKPDYVCYEDQIKPNPH